MTFDWIKHGFPKKPFKVIVKGASARNRFAHLAWLRTLGERDYHWSYFWSEDIWYEVSFTHEEDLLAFKLVFQTG
jgi:hypothetical protein